MRAQWDHRNADRRGRTKEANHVIHHECSLHQTTDRYVEALEILAADRDLLAEPIKEKLQKSPDSLELWLKCTHPIV